MRSQTAGEFGSEGYFRVYEKEGRMEWGAEVYRGYLGRLLVSDLGGGKSEVTVELYFGERSAEGEIQEQSSEDRDPLEEAVDATLEFIWRQIEEDAGKIGPPSPTG